VNRRAILLGVPRYRDDAVPPLPILQNDFRELREVLIQCGFAIEVHGVDDAATNDFRQGLGRNDVTAQVSKAIRDARQGEHLLIFFSGHGVHYKGRDYLLPADFFLDEKNFASYLVPLEFTHELEDSHASHIVFAVDACREDFQMGRKAAQIRWTRGKVQRANGKMIATIFACQSGEYSRYVPGSEGFSLFTRAFTHVLSAQPSVDFISALQSELDRLASQHSKPKQTITVRADLSGRLKLIDTVAWLLPQEPRAPISSDVGRKASAPSIALIPLVLAACAALGVLVLWRQFSSRPTALVEPTPSLATALAVEKPTAVAPAPLAEPPPSSNSPQTTAGKKFESPRPDFNKRLAVANSKLAPAHPADALPAPIAPPSGSAGASTALALPPPTVPSSDSKPQAESPLFTDFETKK